ncbi:MAG TPA: DUF3168 domain-containing protein [Rhizomicrobium sp.]|nr:DUF3168 domain-containing protein [Rhizomicrobium sp.]
MSSASFSLQAALFAALAADAGVKSALGDPPRIYDLVPREPVFPYCALGDDGEAAWDTATGTGSEHRLALDIWSRGGGHKESKDAADAVRAALDAAALSPAGYTLVNLRYLGADFARQPDGETYRATLHVRAVMEMSE